MLRCRRRTPRRARRRSRGRSPRPRPSASPACTTWAPRSRTSRSIASSPTRASCRCASRHTPTATAMRSPRCARWVRTSTHRGRLQMRGVKLYADGALGSRGAALLADYHDEPGQRGLLVTEPAALEAAMVKARDCGVQVATHAIGDRANRMVLDAYARVQGQGAAERRWRIEHAQIVALDDIPRFGAAARDRVDAADPRDVDMPLGRIACRQGGPARRLRLAALHRQRRKARLWLGLPRRVRRSASRPLRRDHARGPRRQTRGRVATGPEAHRRSRRCAASRRTPRTRHSRNPTSAGSRPACALISSCWTEIRSQSRRARSPTCGSAPRGSTDRSSTPPTDSENQLRADLSAIIASAARFPLARRSRAIR